MVGESLVVGKLPVTVCKDVSVFVIAGIGVEVGIIVAVAKDIVTDGDCIPRVDCIIDPTGAHPTNTKASIKESANQPNDFIIKS